MTQTPENMTTENPTPEKMTLAEFEQRLPEFFATGTGAISNDPRLQAFLAENPDSAGLVRDLEYIAAAAGDLLKKEDIEPSDSVWKNIQNELKSALPDGPGPEPATS